MDGARFEEAARRFAAISTQDPAREKDEHGAEQPRERLQAERLAHWVERLAPAASEALRLAALCQHVGRFQVPRSTYPDGRVGYLKWRTELARRHAETAARVLSEVGYDEALIQNVRHIVLKQNLRHDPEVAVMEDALCLAFLEYELEEFCARHDDEKLVSIVQKTWKKMSPAGHAAALALPLSERAARIVKLALEQAGAS